MNISTTSPSDLPSRQSVLLADGEISLAGVAGAITAAVYRATGVRMCELAVKIEDLLV